MSGLTNIILISASVLLGVSPDSSVSVDRGWENPAANEHVQSGDSKEAAQPLVRLLGRMGSDGKPQFFEEYGPWTPEGTPVIRFGDIQGAWVERSGGVWQVLLYATPEDDDVSVELFWYGGESVRIGSEIGAWYQEDWTDSSGVRVGRVFSASMLFSNVAERVDTVSSSVDGVTAKFLLRVDNPARAGGPDLPEPILAPSEPKDPPQGPDPIL